MKYKTQTWTTAGQMAKKMKIKESRVIEIIKSDTLSLLLENCVTESKGNVLVNEEGKKVLLDYVSKNYGYKWNEAVMSYCLVVKSGKRKRTFVIPLEEMDEDCDLDFADE